MHDLYVHLPAAVPDAFYLEVQGFVLESFVAEPLEMDDGIALAPDRPATASATI